MCWNCHSSTSLSTLHTWSQIAHLHSSAPPNSLLQSRLSPSHNLLSDHHLQTNSKVSSTPWNATLSIQFHLPFHHGLISPPIVNLSLTQFFIASTLPSSHRKLFQKFINSFGTPTICFTDGPKLLNRSGFYSIGNFNNLSQTPQFNLSIHHSITSNLQLSSTYTHSAIDFIEDVGIHFTLKEDCGFVESDFFLLLNYTHSATPSTINTFIICSFRLPCSSQCNFPAVTFTPSHLTHTHSIHVLPRPYLSSSTGNLLTQASRTTSR